MASPFKKAEKSWKNIFGGLQDPKNKDLLELLAEEYLAEQKKAEQLAKHAEELRYRHLRDKLIEIARTERKHADKLREIIQKLGGTVPKYNPAVPEEKEKPTFQKLIEDLEKENDNYWGILETLFNAEQKGYMEIIPELNQLREEEARLRNELLDILQITNPYTL
jgi:bacterioferritin (cytochrome b1)